ncbi:hypothetical protein Bbelb_146870 [Branchiostoma belcheri]|nr:hypothetical protein Bbelb_146870 [Branchiostoma belcheri]
MPPDPPTLLAPLALDSRFCARLRAPSNRRSPLKIYRIKLGERKKVKLGRALADVDSDCPLFVDALGDQGRWKTEGATGGPVDKTGSQVEVVFARLAEWTGSGGLISKDLLDNHQDLTWDILIGTKGGLQLGEFRAIVACYCLSEYTTVAGQQADGVDSVQAEVPGIQHAPIIVVRGSGRGDRQGYLQALLIRCNGCELLCQQCSIIPAAKSPPTGQGSSPHVTSNDKFTLLNICFKCFLHRQAEL